jgi:hypothetical protein
MPITNTQAPSTFQPPYETRGTNKSFGNQNKTNKAACEASGGFWDENTQTCIPKVLTKTEDVNTFAPVGSKDFGKKQTTVLTPAEVMNLPRGDNVPSQNTTTAMEKAKLTIPEIIRDENGIITGIALPNGEVYPNIGQKNVEQMLRNYNLKTQAPEGTVEAGTAQAQLEAQQRLQQLTQMAQQGLLTPQELQAIQGSNPNYAQAAGAGAVGLLPGLAGLAGGLALSASGVGAIAGVPIAAVSALSVAGSIAGFIVGAKNSLKGQQTEQFAADKAALTKGQTYLRALITDTNKYPEHAPENIADFYRALSLIDVAHAKTYKDAHENVNKAIGAGGFDNLAQFEVFDNTMRDYYINAFNAALANPNPNATLITAEDLGAVE